jgi:glycosyltransferase involved in cell wall biosynthesis
MKLSVPQEAVVAAPPAAAKTCRSLHSARIAIVHYWFVTYRGGERLVESIAAMFPKADLFCPLVRPEALPQSLRGRRLKTSFLGKIPGSKRMHRQLLPLYPLALEQFDLSGYDLVISSESGPAKGVITPAGTCHVCYCHSPMRYLWDFYHRYRNGTTMGLLSRPFFTLASHYLRLWDIASADRVDYFAANSANVAARIRKHYRRDATVIYPPLYIEGYLAERIDDYYLAVGQLVDYKRMDLAIIACNRLGRRLHIVGAGEQYARLRSLAGPTIVFCGSLSQKALNEQYAHCRALLFPGEEDFGSVPVEAHAFGRPVIAYGRGGARETLKGFYPDSAATPESSTGVFFREQSADALIEAMQTFEDTEHRFSPLYIKQHAERFNPAQFQENFCSFVAAKYEEFRSDALPM